jgi:hypothetical protein
MAGKLARKTGVEIVKVRESAPQFRAAALRSQKAEIPLTALWNYEGAKQCDVVVLELCHAILLECVSDVVCDAGYRVIEASDEVVRAGGVSWSATPQRANVRCRIKTRDRRSQFGNT